MTSILPYADVRALSEESIDADAALWNHSLQTY